MYEGLRSLLCDSIWSLTLPRVGRTSGAKKFRSSARRDFFRQHRHECEVPRRPQYFRYGGKVEAARTSFVIDPSRTSANNGDGGWQSTGSRIATRLWGKYAASRLRLAFRRDALYTTANFTQFALYEAGCFVTPKRVTIRR